MLNPATRLPIFTSATLVSVSTQPPAFVAINLTVNEPGLVYICVGEVVVLVPPSPKLHWYEVAPVDVFVKVAVNGTEQELLLAEVKPAVGLGKTVI
jgi:hypothetical protein